MAHRRSQEKHHEAAIREVEAAGPKVRRLRSGRGDLCSSGTYVMADARQALAQRARAERLRLTSMRDDVEASLSACSASRCLRPLPRPCLAMP